MDAAGYLSRLRTRDGPSIRPRDMGGVDALEMVRSTVRYIKEKTRTGELIVSRRVV